MRARNRLLGARILVVEDAADLRELLQWRLEAEGASVVAAGAGREALELAAASSFDIALTDLDLPDVSGATVISGLRSMCGARAGESP